MTGALGDIRVIDFGQYIAGPLAAMLLADQGADVIRVDPPGGPRWHTPANATWNRGKRSIALDLKKATDRDIARQLVRSADVVIENFRPGVMDRLGLGPEAMTAANPRLIYCSLPGFASDDSRASVPAWEGVVGAATGTYRVRQQVKITDAGTNRYQAAGALDEPVYTILPISSVYAAFHGAASIAMALYARERDGLGQRIEVPLFDATFTAIGTPQWDGVTLSPWLRQYECADGRWVHINPYRARWLMQFIRTAGVEHWLNEPFVGDLAQPTRVLDPEQAAELLDRLTALFRTRTAQQWEDSINEAGLAASICRTSAEWLEHPQARESQMIIEIDDPTYGPMLQPGLQVRLSDTPGAVRGPAPAPDQHRHEILAELAGRPSPVSDLAAPRGLDRRPPLDGLRVLDLGIILVGPTCGRTLVEFGADVIKIDDPNGMDPSPDVSRGKRSMLLDLTRPAGREVLWKLIDRGDIFLQNFRKGVADRLGFGYEQVHQRRPDIVYISMNTYGHLGPWAGRPGFENQAQAVTGMQARFGGGPPAMQPFAVNDYGTGIMGAYAVALALYQRLRTGRGQHGDTALCYTACTMQSPVLQGYTGKVWEEPRGQNVLGSGPLHRIYRASDGWLFLGAREADISSLESVAGIQGVSQTPIQQLAAFLEERLASGSATEWVSRLTAAGVGAHKVVKVAEMTDDPWVAEHGLRLTREHPDGGVVDTIGPVPRLSRTPVRPGRPLRPSLDAPEILADVKLDADLDRLVNDGVVVVRPPAPAGQLTDHFVLRSDVTGRPGAG